MRRFDVWVGRLAAVAGLLYVALASLWPLTAAGAPAWIADPAAVVISDAARLEAFAGVLPLRAPPADVRLVRVLADVSEGREQRRQARRSTEASAIGTTSESVGMLLVAAGIFCAAVAATVLRRPSGAGSSAAPDCVTARSACRLRLAAES